MNRISVATFVHGMIAILIVLVIGLFIFGRPDNAARNYVVNFWSGERPSADARLDDSNASPIDGENLEQIKGELTSANVAEQVAGSIDENESKPQDDAAAQEDAPVLEETFEVDGASDAELAPVSKEESSSPFEIDPFELALDEEDANLDNVESETNDNENETEPTDALQNETNDALETFAISDDFFDAAESSSVDSELSVEANASAISDDFFDSAESSSVDSDLTVEANASAISDDFFDAAESSSVDSDLTVEANASAISDDFFDSVESNGDALVIDFESESAENADVDDVDNNDNNEFKAANASATSEGAWETSSVEGVADDSWPNEPAAIAEVAMNAEVLEEDEVANSNPATNDYSFDFDDEAPDEFKSGPNSLPVSAPLPTDGLGADETTNAADEPVVLETIETVEETPIAVDEAVAVEEPVDVDETVVIEEPVVVDEAIAVEEPVDVDEAVVIEEPVVVDEAIAVEEPVVVDETVVVEEPVVVDETIAVEEPVVVDEAAAVEEPVVVDETVVVEEPAVVDEAVAVEEPVVDEPVEFGAKGEAIFTFPAANENVAELETEKGVKTNASEVAEEVSTAPLVPCAPIQGLFDAASAPIQASTDSVISENSASSNESGLGNEIWIVGADGSDFYYLHHGADGWRRETSENFWSGDDPARATIVWSHGFQTDIDSAANEAFEFSQVLNFAQRRAAAPRAYRLIVWKWASERSIPRIRKDAQVKAAIANYDGRLLAHFVGRLNPKDDVALIGFSFGARVVGSALQTLAHTGFAMSDVADASFGADFGARIVATSEEFDETTDFAFAFSGADASFGALSLPEATPKTNAMGVSLGVVKFAPVADEYAANAAPTQAADEADSSVEKTDDVDDSAKGRLTLILVSAACDLGAFDAGGVYGDGAKLATRVLNVYNPFDVALKYYPFVSESRSQALGTAPIFQRTFPNANPAPTNVDVQSVLGKRHSFSDAIRCVPIDRLSELAL